MPVGALDLGQELVVTAGSWVSDGDEARFTPRFATVPGTRFAVVARQAGPGSAWRELGRVVVPDTVAAPTTVVERIEPSVGEVPENILRFAVTFSAPMEEGSASGRLRLLDEAGGELAGTLLDMPPELWDRDRRRLTVLLEPGRIKRGLQPNVQAGPPLREGGSVTLVVDATIRDATGASLVSEVRRTYRVAPPIRTRLDPARWQVTWPEGPQDALNVVFDRPLDPVLALRCLWATDEHGLATPGAASLDPEARVWTFVPASGAAPHALHVDVRLEDLAGNSVRRVFDRDLAAPGDVGIDAAEVVLRSRGGADDGPLREAPHPR
ncbi:hypothetical protein AS850_15875 [Frondihabitans sp. 762G35]|uniref:hypothetical protein n=1 Tax=Frondihabitans sp. 762G35 TaxID=1446794 RepID=UPI000D209150|nr:hypothetical protein [Frondihabitans sp. 762G35]ARC58567.1 hypothetical protein AS850_15875 [Frondihabitans sp. 762G35]